MTNTCCCDDTSFLDASPQFTRRRCLHIHVQVVESVEHGVELEYCGGTIYRPYTRNIIPVPRQIFEVWCALRGYQFQCLRECLGCIFYLLFCFGPLCCWISDEYLEASRSDYFRRHYLPPGYRVEISRSDSTYTCSCLPVYCYRMYVTREVYEAAAAADPAYQERVRIWEAEQHAEQEDRDLERRRREQQQDRLLARPEARRQLSNLRESTVEEVLISCDLNNDRLAYEQRFRREGVNSVQLLCELTYEDLGFMRAGDRRRLFLYLHPQESITGSLITRAVLVPPASVVRATPPANST